MTDKTAPPSPQVLIRPIAVEVRRLNVKPGDVVMITPKTDIPPEALMEMHRGLEHLTRATKIQFVLGHRDLDVTVVHKEPA